MITHSESHDRLVTPGKELRSHRVVDEFLVAVKACLSQAEKLTNQYILKKKSLI